MKLSREHINKLNSPSYQEYLRLKRRERFWWRLFWLLTYLFILFSLGFVEILIFAYLEKPKFIIGGVLGWFFVLYSFGWFCGGYDDEYTKVFNFFFKRTNLFQRIEQKELYLAPIREQIEQQLNEYIEIGLTDLFKQLRKNSGNEEAYQGIYEILQENHLFIDEATKFLNQNSEAKRNYYTQIRKEFWVEKGTLIKKNKSKISTTPYSPPIFEKSYSKRNKSETSKTSKLDTPAIRHRCPNPYENPYKNQVNENNEGKETPIEKNTQLNLPFNDRTKSKQPKYGRVIQVSQEYYSELAKRKMEIGMKGELFVLEYEKQRLQKEGRQFVNKLQHASKEIGDGLGYDIISFADRERIFIEVKTTIGKATSSIFFTEAEFNAMNKYKEQYYLYRVYEFDEETNLGELLIYTGKDMIDKYFNFSPKVYVLSQKSD